MADTKISALPAVTDVIGTDQYVLVRGADSKKIVASDLLVADAVAFTPAGTVSATDVQAAIEEVAIEAGSGGDFALIADIDLTSVQSFTSIPGTYTTLRMIYVGRGSNSGFKDITVRFNTDSGSNYDYNLTNMFNGSVSQSTGFAGTSGRAGIIPGSDATSGRAGQNEMLIPYYSSTTFNKECVTRSSVNGSSTAASYAVQEIGMTWRSTAAITQIDLIVPTGSWASGSHAHLYGLA